MKNYKKIFMIFLLLMFISAISAYSQSRETIEHELILRYNSLITIDSVKSTPDKCFFWGKTYIPIFGCFFLTDRNHFYLIDICTDFVTYDFKFSEGEICGCLNGNNTKISPTGIKNKSVKFRKIKK